MRRRKYLIGQLGWQILVISLFLLSNPGIGEEIKGDIFFNQDFLSQVSKKSGPGKIFEVAQQTQNSAIGAEQEGSDEYGTMTIPELEDLLQSLRQQYKEGISQFQEAHPELKGWEEKRKKFYDQFSSAMQSIKKEQLDKLSPEEREKYEKLMKSHGTVEGQRLVLELIEKLPPGDMPLLDFHTYLPESKKLSDAQYKAFQKGFARDIVKLIKEMMEKNVKELEQLKADPSLDPVLRDRLLEATNLEVQGDLYNYRVEHVKRTIPAEVLELKKKIRNQEKILYQRKKAEYR